MDYSQRAGGTHPLSGRLWRRGSGALPALPAPLLLRPRFWVFQCPGRDAVAAAAPPPDCKPHSASAPPTSCPLPTVAALGAEAGSAYSGRQTLGGKQTQPRPGGVLQLGSPAGVSLLLPSDWSHLCCLNAAGPRTPGSSGSTPRSTVCGSRGVWASSGGVWVKQVRTEVSRETKEALRVAGCEDEARCTLVGPWRAASTETGHGTSACHATFEKPPSSWAWRMASQGKPQLGVTCLKIDKKAACP